MESLLGADIRLIYGMAVPTLAVVAAMIPMFLHPTYWLVGSVVAFELICLSVVLNRILTWLGEEE